METTFVASFDVTFPNVGSNISSFNHIFRFFSNSGFVANPP